MFETRVQYDILKIIKTKNGMTTMSHVLFNCQPARIEPLIEGMCKALADAPEVETFTITAMEEIV